MPAIPPTHRSKLEGSGIAGGVGGGGGELGGVVGPGMMFGIKGIKGAKGSPGGKEMSAAARANGGGEATGAKSPRLPSGILHSTNTGCFFESG